MSNATFIEFIGDVWLHGKSVAAYRKADGNIQLRAETSGGKIIALIKNVDASEYETLRSKFYAGCFHQDARIAERALAYMGVGA